MTTSFFLQMFLNGLQLASIYILIALGFTLIFGILQIVNIAHCSIYMLGGYAIWLFFAVLKWNYLLSLVATIVVIGFLGVVIERVVFRRLQGLMMPTVIASIGLMVFVEQSALVIFGYSHKTVPNPFPGILRFWGTVFPTQRMAIFVLGVALTTALILWIKKTKVGLAMRTVAQDSDTASLYGMNFSRFGAIAFGIGCGLAGAAGALIAPVFYVTPFMGHGPLVKVFIIIIIGGLGSVPGAVIAGVFLGLLDSFVTTLVDPETASMVAFGLIILMFMFKPTGLLGHE
jgi:branched-chain amino acid transport system permease protein